MNLHLHDGNSILSIAEDHARFLRELLNNEVFTPEDWRKRGATVASLNSGSSDCRDSMSEEGFLRTALSEAEAVIAMAPLSFEEFQSTHPLEDVYSEYCEYCCRCNRAASEYKLSRWEAPKGGETLSRSSDRASTLFEILGYQVVRTPNGWAERFSIPPHSDMLELFKLANSAATQLRITPAIYLGNDDDTAKWKMFSKIWTSSDVRTYEVVGFVSGSSGITDSGRRSNLALVNLEVPEPHVAALANILRHLVSKGVENIFEDKKVLVEIPGRPPSYSLVRGSHGLTLLDYSPFNYDSRQAAAGYKKITT